MKRHNGRIIAVLTLYNMDLSKLTSEETLHALNDLIMMEADEEYPVEIDTLYAHKIVDGVCTNLNIVDDIVSKSLVKYTIDRLSFVDRALIRVATYEMKFMELDPKVAIDEALKCKETGEAKNIVFGLTGTGYFDMYAYQKFNDGIMGDYIPTDDEINQALAKLPKV